VCLSLSLPAFQIELQDEWASIMRHPPSIVLFRPFCSVFRSLPRCPAADLIPDFASSIVANSLLARLARNSPKSETNRFTLPPRERVNGIFGIIGKDAPLELRSTFFE